MDFSIKTHPFSLISLLLLLLVALTGCSNDDQGRSEGDKPPLRVLTLSQPGGPQALPRSGLPESAELELLETYAQAQQREMELVFVDKLDQLLPSLLKGKGDIAAANLTVTDARKKEVAFTLPIAYVHEVLIARAGESFENAQDLGGRSVAVKASSSFAGTLKAIQERRFQPDFEINYVDESLSGETLLNRVAAGKYDLTVLDSNSADALLSGRDDLHQALKLGNVNSIAWAVEPQNRELVESINTFIGENQLLASPNEPYTGDLPALKKRRVLRVATRNNAATYYLWRGELLGFEYELIKRFADQQGLRLEMVVPEKRGALIDLVHSGRADLATASLTITEQRKEREGIVFSRPYHYVTELLISRADDPIESVAELTGRTVAVRRSSSYWQTLQQLQQQGHEFELTAVPEDLETEEVIARVASGDYDLTVADSHIVDIEMTWRDDIRSAFALGEPLPHGWAMRAKNPKLKQAVDAFIKKEYRGLFYNVTYDKYFKDSKRIIQHVEERPDRNADGTISPYDELARKYASQYGLDWRLLLSQVYQESRFDPTAKSWAGALGLMQVLPRTAKEFGLTDLHDPETGLHAGVKYLTWLMQRFEPDLDLANRTWFALAAYNAGVGHVRDARTLAKKQGLDPDIWFDNVERAMLLLAKKKYYRHARYGYVRGEEPVNYVQQIRDRFRAYAEMSGGG